MTTTSVRTSAWSSRPTNARPPSTPNGNPCCLSDAWSEARVAKANRNYAVEFIRNGIRELVPVIGEAKTLEHGKLAARLTGLQHWRPMAGAVGGVVALRHTGLRIVRGLTGPERDHLLACWVELWRGAVHSHREFMAVDAKIDGDAVLWNIRPA